MCRQETYVAYVYICRYIYQRMYTYLPLYSATAGHSVGTVSTVYREGEAHFGWLSYCRQSGQVRLAHHARGTERLKRRLALPGLGADWSEPIN